MDSVVTAWRALVDEEARFAAQFVPSNRDRENRRGTEPALDVALAGWGLPVAIERVRGRPEHETPEYLRARAAEIQASRPEPERARIEVVRRWSSILLWTNVTLVATGVVGALLWWRRRRDLAGTRATPLAFGLPQAACLFFGTVAAHEALFRLSWMDIGASGEVIRLFHSTLFGAIVVGALLLTRLAPSRTPIRDMLAIPRDRKGRLVALGATLVTVGLASGFKSLLSRAAVGPFAPSWGEGLNETLMYGPALEAAGTAMEYLIMAPISEEILFRGIFFGALLSRSMGANPSPDVGPRVHRAALLSGVLFSLWHGYGLVGTLDVVLSGYLLARLYAHTGSLVPCMVVHSSLNVVPLFWGLAMRV